jgi:hypothetical protein
MKTNIVRIVFTALLIISAAPLASAQRSNMQSFVPVVEMKAAQEIPVGTQIAVSCNSGGPVTILTVDKDRSYLKGYTCPVTKRVYTVSTGGRAGGTGFVYKTEDGFTARILVMSKEE